MLSDLGLPEGKIISQHEGGNGSLQDILNRARRYKFIGYLRLSLSLGEKRSQGIIAFEMGQPLLSVYVYRWGSEGRSGRVYMGRKAVEFIWEDSVFPQAGITLHTDISLREVEGLFPNSEIAITDLVAPAYLPGSAPAAEDDVEDDLVTPVIRVWSKRGYDLSALQRLLRRNPEEARLALPYFESLMAELEILKSKLIALDGTGYEREAESLLRKMVNPERIGEVERELDSFVRKIEGREEDSSAEKQIRIERERKIVDEKMGAVYDLILQYHKMRSAGERTISCPECGSYLNGEGECPICFAGSQNGPALGRKLNPRFTFDSFVVGPNSRFAEAAAKAVARNPGNSYNPLLIYSGSGLGKTHLLQAIGNYIKENDPTRGPVYTSTEVLEGDLIEALSGGEIERFKEEYMEADVLLLDDLQFIAGREELQEVLFQLFNQLVDQGKQIVLTCDRLPKDIPALSERLTTRFESGLIADLQPPGLDTRIAILNRMAKEKGIEIPQGVISFIAEVCQSNVRELEGGLNRILAYTSLMNCPMNLETAKEVLTYQRPEGKGARPPPSLSDGVSYLVEERKALASHLLTATKLGEGYKAMAITRSHPRYLRKHCLSGDPRILWLTDHESKGEDTVPPSLERIMLLIDEFMEQEGKKIILLDDVQYLVSNTSFEGVIRFIRSVVDKVHEDVTIFIVSVDPESLDPQDRSVLEREMEVIREIDVMA